MRAQDQCLKETDRDAFGERYAAGYSCHYDNAIVREIKEGKHKLGENKLGENPKDRLGVQKPSMHLVPVDGLIAVGEVMKLGAAKYGPYNWRDNAVVLTVYLDAMLRHYAAYLDGQDLDPESNQPHTAHIAACMLILLDADATGNLVDDRPTKGKAAEMLEALVKTVVDTYGKTKEDCLPRNMPELPDEINMGGIDLPMPVNSITEIPGHFPSYMLGNDDGVPLVPNDWTDDVDGELGPRGVEEDEQHEMRMRQSRERASAVRAEKVREWALRNAEEILQEEKNKHPHLRKDWVKEQREQQSEVKAETMVKKRERFEAWERDQADNGKHA